MDFTQMTYDLYIYEGNERASASILDTPKFVYVKEYDYFIPEEYKDYVEALSKEYGIPSWVMPRIFTRESGWDEKAVNRNNKDGSVDYGIAMLNSNNLEYFAWKFNGGKEVDYFNGKESILISVRYFNHLHKQFGNLEKAIMAYNCGPGKVKRNTIPESTKEYLAYVTQYTLVQIQVRS